MDVVAFFFNILLNTIAMWLVMRFMMDDEYRQPFWRCGVCVLALTFGPVGFIIGPILVAMLLAFIGIYRDYYLPGYDRKKAPTTPSP